MRLRLPLSFKIVAWFFLNLLLLALGFALLFYAKIGFDSILGTLAKPNVQSVSRVVAQELNSQPTSAWDNVLTRFDVAYSMDFGLYWNEGKQIAGRSMKLPPSVMEHMPHPAAHPEKIGVPPAGGTGDPLFGALDGPQPGRPPPRPPFPGPPGGGPGGGGPGGGGPGGGGPGGDSGTGGGPPPLPPGERPGFDPRPHRVDESTGPLFIISTTHPTAYWAGVGIPLFDPMDGNGLPVTLVMRGQALAGGFFFDSKPWLVAGFGAMLLSVLFWFPLVRGLTQTIRRVTGATAKLAEGDFTVRAPDQRGDELGTLGRSVNVMAEKLAGFIHGQKRFLGDIAHELCSPIARMQAAMGIMEQQNADPAHTRNVERMGRELRHMSDLVNELLSFSKASLHRDLELQPVRLAPLVRRVMEREASGSSAILAEIPDQITVLAEPELLARAIGNVVRNALRYAGDAGPIQLHASNSGDEVCLSIQDQGPGVSEAALPKLFDAFYRPDLSRTRDTGGVGLGLAIVKSCVEACHGTVTAEHVSPHGLEIKMRLVNAA